MRFADLAQLSLRVFRTRPTRTLLTILGMGVGMGSVLFLVGLGYGLQSILLQRIASDDTLLSLAVSNPTSGVLVLDEETTTRLQQLPHIKAVAPLAAFPAQMNLGELTGNTVVRAVPASFFTYAGVSTIHGKLFAPASHEIVVSEAVLKLFNLENPESALTKEVSLQVFVPKNGARESDEVTVVTLPDRYRIVGVVEGPDASFIFLPLEAFTENTHTLVYEQARVRVEAEEYVDAARESIVGMGFQVASLSDTLEQANKIFRAIQITLGLLGAIALMVSAIGMINTMTVTLLERTNEIGIMRAIGASERDIKLLFLGEAVVMGFLGGLAGVAIGIFSGTAVNFGINFLATSLGGKAVDLFSYPVWFVVTMIVFSGIIGFITGIFPARRAARLDPLEALRYK